ncbi:conserved hypothetical protein [Burkholderia sp. H160]|nr:conserved hypothetical protein [Burkholderia sp. H160]
MGLWNFYFIAKLYLAGIGKLQPLWWLNLLFAIALLVPFGDRRLRVVRNLVAVVIGIALLYFELGEPAFSMAAAHLPQQHALALIVRIVPLSTLVALATLFVAYYVVSRWVRVTTFVLISLFAILVWQGFSALTAQASSNVDSARACPPASPGRSEPAVNPQGE